MTRSWKPPKKDRTDAEAIRREQEFREKLRDVLVNGGEDDFVAVLKAYQPDISKEELLRSIMQFRVYVREKRGLY